MSFVRMESGAEDGPISGHWRIEGNRLIQGDASGTIILLMTTTSFTRAIMMQCSFILG
jgi:hypothetical protein